MNVYSKRLEKDIELQTEKYGDLELISHQSLVDVFSGLDGVDITYSVISSDTRHSVIFGTISDSKGIRITEIGEALDASLANDISRMYPTTMAFTRAFDRALVKYLMLPGKNYTNSEIITSEAPPEALQMVIETPKQVQENPAVMKTVPDMTLDELGSIKITIGKYADCPSTVEQIANNRAETTWTNFIIDKFSSNESHPFRFQAEALKTYIEKGGRK